MGSAAHDVELCSTGQRFMMFSSHVISNEFTEHSGAGNGCGPWVAASKPEIAWQRCMTGKKLFT